MDRLSRPELFRFERMTITKHALRIRDVFDFTEIFILVGMFDLAEEFVVVEKKIVRAVEADDLYFDVKYVFENFALALKSFQKVFAVNGRIKMKANVVSVVPNAPNIVGVFC